MKFLARSVQSFNHSRPPGAGGSKDYTCPGQELHIFGKSGLPELFRFSRNSGRTKTVKFLAADVQSLRASRARGCRKNACLGEKNHVWGRSGSPMTFPESLLREPAQEKKATKTESPNSMAEVGGGFPAGPDSQVFAFWGGGGGDSNLGRWLF